jgi:WXG100 family type VII secretion target
LNIKELQNIMSMKILVSPEELDGISRQFKNGADQSRQQCSTLRNALNSLDGRWDGATKQRFFTQFEQSQKHMEAYTQLLDSIGQELADIATRFRQVDGQ